MGDSYEDRDGYPEVETYMGFNQGAPGGKHYGLDVGV